MNNLIKIGNQNISVKEFKNQRVITFKDIDSVHERPEGTARKRFNDNKKRFINGTDFFVITAPSEIRTLGIERPQGGTPEKVTLITESGYLMIVKSLTDDLAWEVQRQLVDSYFRNVKPLSQVEMMRIQLGMIDDHENRIVNLENNMTLDYGQQKVLEGVVNKTVILPVIVPILSKSGCTLIVTNQIRDKVGVMFGNPEGTTGGRALKHFATLRLDIRRMETLKENGGIIGVRTTVKVVKNKVSAPYKNSEFDIIFKSGISVVGDLLDYAFDSGLVNKNGASYYFENKLIGRGRSETVNHLREDPDLLKRIKQNISS